MPLRPADIREVPDLQERDFRSPFFHVPLSFLNALLEYIDGVFPSAKTFCVLFLVNFLAVVVCRRPDLDSCSTIHLLPGNGMP